MNKSNQLSAIAVIASVLISACSTTGDSGVIAPTLTSTDQSAAAVGDAVIGDTISLPAGNPTGASSADVISEYFAASNRRCRQVLPRGEQSVRIACEHRNGSWHWVRTLTTSEVAQPIPALVAVGAAEPIGVVADVEALSGSDVVDVSTSSSAGYEQRLSVEPGETLWKFSR